MLMAIESQEQAKLTGPCDGPHTQEKSRKSKGGWNARKVKASVRATVQDWVATWPSHVPHEGSAHLPAQAPRGAHVQLGALRCDEAQVRGQAPGVAEMPRRRTPVEAGHPVRGNRNAR